MIVKPTLLTHPKFRRLERCLGKKHRRDALYMLIRLWAHCEEETRGGVWHGADLDYVELVTGWDGEPGLGYQALLECGWIDELSGENPGGSEKIMGESYKAAGVIVHDWDDTNRRLISSWKNGTAGGRRSRSAATPEKTHDEPTDELGHPKDDVCITHDEPTDELAGTQFGQRGEERRGEEKNPPVAPQGGQGDVPIPDPPVMVPREVARRWFERIQEAGANFDEADFDEAFRLLHSTRDVRSGAWKMGRSGLVSDPRTFLEQRLGDARDRRLRKNGGAGPSPAAQVYTLRERIDATRRILADHKGRPDGSWPESVREEYAEEYSRESRNLGVLERELAAIAG